MGRKLLALMGILCISAVLAEGMALGILYFRGQLSREGLAAAAGVLTGDVLPATASPSEELVPVAVSAAEREATATMQHLELASQANDLRVLKDILEAAALRTTTRRDELMAEREAFQAELARIREQLAADSTRQAQDILKSLASADAVIYLSEFPEEQAVLLLRGLPERNLGKLLEQFARGTDEERQRGQALFAALANGNPETALIDRAAASPAVRPQ